MTSYCILSSLRVGPISFITICSTCADLALNEYSSTEWMVCQERGRRMRSRGALPFGLVGQMKYPRGGGAVGLWLVVCMHWGKGLRKDTPFQGPWCYFIFLVADESLGPPLTNINKWKHNILTFQEACDGFPSGTWFYMTSNYRERDGLCEI